MSHRFFLLLFSLFFGLIAPSAADQEEEFAALSLEELLNIEISTAAKYKQTSREAAASITIITAEDIKRFGYRTLADVLASVRGFYAGDDRNYAYVGIRGFSRPTDYNSRVLLLLNGPLSMKMSGGRPA